ncbi:MAG: PA2779 family protein [Betaproteobacteria bacterium]
MNLSLIRTVCRILVACMILLPFQASAGLIGTDQAVSAAQAGAARDKVISLIERTEVARQLQAYGLTPENAKLRVHALTGSEVAQLAARLDNMPAGANGSGAVLLLAAVVLVVWLFWN